MLKCLNNFSDLSFPWSHGWGARFPGQGISPLCVEGGGGGRRGGGSCEGKCILPPTHPVFRKIDNNKSWVEGSCQDKGILPPSRPFRKIDTSKHWVGGWGQAAQARVFSSPGASCPGQGIFIPGGKLCRPGYRLPSPPPNPLPLERQIMANNCNIQMTC